MDEKNKPKDINLEDDEDQITDDDTVVISTKDVNGKSSPNVEVKKGGKRKKMIELEEEIEELKESLLRHQADFENYKKRINQEKIQDRKYAGMDIIHDLLVPLDQLNKVVNVKTDDPKLNNYLIGFKMINDQLYNVLADNGVTPIESIDKQFDPKVHYAVEKESNKEKENGIILEEIQKGYIYKDRIIRPAMVKVNEWSE